MTPEMNKANNTGEWVRCVKMWFKKKRLLKKYAITDKKMSNQLHLLRMMKDDKEFCDYYRHQIYCELRLLARIKRGFKLLPSPPNK